MPKDFKGQEPIGWFTAKGVHIPLYEGETPDSAMARLKEEWTEKLLTRSFKKFRAVEGVEEEVKKFMDNSDNSNTWVWREELSGQQERAFYRYTGTDDVYDINDALYNGKTDSLSSEQKSVIKNLDEAISGFSLYKGITATRQGDERMLGFKQGEKLTKQKIIDKLQETYGHLQYPAYLSSGVDDEGVAVATTGSVKVHIQVPPSKGAGAYLANRKTSAHSDENEFLFARNAVLKYDIGSLKEIGALGIWEINARWIGIAEEG